MSISFAQDPDVELVDLDQVLAEFLLSCDRSSAGASSEDDRSQFEA